MNIVNFIKNYISQGMTPENIILKFAGNNPVIKNLVEMQKQGNTKGIETFARNLFKEKGLDFDEEYSKLRNMLK